MIRVRAKKAAAVVVTTCRECRVDGVPVNLVETKDAIGRPRLRCPVCQGVNTTPADPGTIGTQHPQTALTSRDRHWGAPAPQSGPARPVIAPLRRS